MSRWPGWPYAVKPVLQYTYIGYDVFIYVTFDCPMNQLYKPALSKWSVLVDGLLNFPTVSAWQDAYTLKLTVPEIYDVPLEVTMKYLGPWVTLRTKWHKQWEPFGYIPAQKLAI